MHTQLLHSHPKVTQLRRLPLTDTSRRASRQRHWNFTPGPSRLSTVSARVPIDLPTEGPTGPHPTAIHPRWQTFRAGPLPPFVRPRGYRGRPRPHRAFRTTRTVATEIFLADAARNRLRTWARRKAARASRPSVTVTHGIERYHALPYGRQPSTLFDISVPWDERVIASD